MSVSGTHTCVLIHSGERYQGKQGLDYGFGISAQSVGSMGICMTVLDPSARRQGERTPA